MHDPTVGFELCTSHFRNTFEARGPKNQSKSTTVQFITKKSILQVYIINITLIPMYNSCI